MIRYIKFSTFFQHSFQHDVENFECQIYLTFLRTVLLEIVQLVQLPKMRQYSYSQIDNIIVLLSHYQFDIINLILS